jgi:hypothetical protein
VTDHLDGWRDGWRHHDDDAHLADEETLDGAR